MDRRDQQELNDVWTLLETSHKLGWPLMLTPPQSRQVARLMERAGTVIVIDGVAVNEVFGSISQGA